jgi:hypothetical protein
LGLLKKKAGFGLGFGKVEDTVCQIFISNFENEEKQKMMIMRLQHLLINLWDKL